MSSGRFSFCLAVAACLASGVAWAEGEGEATSWTDPPARTAPQEPAKPLPEAKSAPETKPPEPTRAEKAPEPAKGEPKSEPTQAQTAPPAAPTQADLRKDQIRRAVARSTAEREAEARGARVPRRSVVERPVPARRLVERPVRLSERPAPSLREGRVARRSLRRPVYGYADPVPAYGRDEAWDEGPPEDFHARRIAQARSAGYIVMRSRSYAYPDGTVVRRLAPLGGADDFYD